MNALGAQPVHAEPPFTNRRSLMRDLEELDSPDAVPMQGPQPSSLNLLAEKPTLFRDFSRATQPLDFSLGELRNLLPSALESLALERLTTMHRCDQELWPILYVLCEKLRAPGVEGQGFDVWIRKHNVTRFSRKTIYKKLRAYASREGLTLPWPERRKGVPETSLPLTSVYSDVVSAEAKSVTPETDSCSRKPGVCSTASPSYHDNLALITSKIRATLRELNEISSRQEFLCELKLFIETEVLGLARPDSPDVDAMPGRQV